MKADDLKNKYVKLSAPVKASLWYTGCNILNKGIALFATPIFTRIMTEEQYGSFAVYQSWYGILSIFATLNIFLGSYQKGLLLFKDDRDCYTSSQLSLTLTITALAFAVYGAGIDFWTGILELSPVLMAAMFLKLAATPALEFWAVRERFEFQYRKYVTVSLIMNILCLGFGVAAVLNTDYKVEARVYSDLLARILIVGPLFFLLMARGRVFFKWTYWKYALKFNLPLLPHYLSNYVLSQSDRLMIGKMAGNRQAAFYSVAYTVSTMMLLITSAINHSLSPYIYRTLDSGEETKLKKVTGPLMGLVAALCVVTMAFAPEVILMFAGENYLEAIYVIPPVAASVFFIFLYWLFSTVEYFYQKTGWIAAATCVSALLNLALNYVFIGIFGYYAAGYTTLACYICSAAMHYISYRRVLRQKKKGSAELYDRKLILALSVLMLLVMVPMAFTYPFAAVRYFMVGAVCAAAVVYRRKLQGIFKMFQ